MKGFLWISFIKWQTQFKIIAFLVLEQVFPSWFTLIKGIRQQFQLRLHNKTRHSNQMQMFNLELISVGNFRHFFFLFYFGYSLCSILAFGMSECFCVMNILNWPVCFDAIGHNSFNFKNICHSHCLCFWIFITCIQMISI